MFMPFVNQFGVESHKNDRIAMLRLAIGKLFHKAPVSMIKLGDLFSLCLTRRKLAGEQNCSSGGYGDLRIQ